MRTILELCTAMDELARDTYSAMSAACDDPDLEEVFKRMSADESEHISWWLDLTEAWDQGLVPDVVNDTEGLERHVHNLFQEMQTTTPADFSEVPIRTMLEISARMEFFLLDPVFGELLDLTEPGGAKKHREAYARHLERIIGAIEMFYGSGGDDMARFLARVLRRAWRDNLALAAFATRDPLTGLYNRRGLMAHLERWLSWAGRYDRPLGVLLVDVDDFRRINDTYGHTIGDIVLKTVADTLTETVRGSDLVARYGGDEFAIIAPETDSEELSALAARLVEAADASSMNDWDGAEIPIGVSVGGAVATNPGATDARADALLATADRSLFAAKRHGKGRAGDILAYHPAAPEED